MIPFDYNLHKTHEKNAILNIFDNQDLVSVYMG